MFSLKLLSSFTAKSTLTKEPTADMNWLLLHSKLSVRLTLKNHFQSLNLQWRLLMEEKQNSSWTTDTCT
jgi:hypothetical protein